MVTDGVELVDLKWIADAAVVGASTVSNWRKRDSTFPQPAGGTDGRPLFNRADVLEWGRATKRFGADSAISEVTVGDQARAILAVMRAHVTPRLFQTAAVYAFARVEGLEVPAWAVPPKRDSSSGMGHFTNAEAFPPDAIEAIAHSLAPILDGRDRAALFEELVAQLADKEFEQLTSTALARSMAALAPGSPDIVLDPAAGVGTLLLEARLRLNPGEVVANDIDIDALLVLWMRFALRGWDVDIARRDALLADADDPAEVRSDLVLLDVPFADAYNRRPGMHGSASSSRWSLDQQWVRAACSRLSPTGVAVVHVLAASGGDAKSADSRTELVLSGALRAVVALPPGMVAGADRRLLSELWVLGSKATDTATVRMIDASSVALDRLPDELKAAIRAGVEPRHSEIPYIDVSRFEIMRSAAVVTPSRWIESSYSTDRANRDLAAASHAIETTTQELGSVSSLSIDIEPATVPTESTTVRELLDSRRVVRVRSSASSIPRRTSDLVEAKVLTGKVLREHEAAAVQRVDQRTLLEPGDVVFSEIGRPVLKVWTEGGWAVGSAVSALRVLDTTLNPEYLRIVLSSAIAEAIGLKGNKVHFDPQLVPIPMPPIEEQFAIVGEISRLETAVRQLESGRERLAGARGALVNAVAAGMVRSGGSPEAAVEHHNEQTDA